MNELITMLKHQEKMFNKKGAAGLSQLMGSAVAEIERLLQRAEKAEAERDELTIKNSELNLDKGRLDLLDKCNSEFNKRRGSSYGWRVDWNHNRIALVDTGIPKTDVRTAIDKFKSLLSMEKRKELEK